jgi:hypothetical protein
VTEAKFKVGDLVTNKLLDEDEEDFDPNGEIPVGIVTKVHRSEVISVYYFYEVKDIITKEEYELIEFSMVPITRDNLVQNIKVMEKAAIAYNTALSVLDNKHSGSPVIY